MKKERSMTAWVLINKTQPMVINERVPIYWKKGIALQDAKVFGGKVERCIITWDV